MTDAIVSEILQLAEFATGGTGYQIPDTPCRHFGRRFAPASSSTFNIAGSKSLRTDSIKDRCGLNDPTSRTGREPN